MEIQAMKLTAKKSFVDEFGVTISDFSSTFRRFSLPYNLAIQDILARYRGSVIGPWWITLASASLILGIGVSYTQLFHVEVSKLLPYVAVGIVMWGCISGTLSEGGESFVSSASLLRQSSLPLPVFIARSILRNLMVLAHQLVIIVAVLAWFRIFPGIGVLWSLVGFGLTMVNLGWAATTIALFSARFRDIPQIVSSSLQFIFFMSPIFWIVPPAFEHSLLVTANPFYFAVDAVRRPLLEGVAPISSLVGLSVIAVVGWLFTLVFYNLTRRRVVHYL